mgnify:CR=1 FL=1
MIILYNAINSKYTYKGTDVLINKLGIKEEEKLKKYEVKMVALKMAIIMKEQKIYDISEERFKYIHFFLFSDLYEFAGKYREENITKDNFMFSDYKYIDENMKIIFAKIDIDKLSKIDFDSMVKFISEIMTDLNVLHPFREGNGRATREFIRELLKKLGYKINFFDIDYNEILEASRLAVIDDSYQIKILKNSIEKN